MSNRSCILVRVIKGILLSLFITACSGEISTNEIIIPEDEIRQGDIAFRRGDGVVSDIVLYNDVDGKYSHVGIIVGQSDSLMVVHAVPGEHDTANDFDRVKIESINRFFGSDVATRGAVMRMSLTDEQCRLIGLYAKEKAEAMVAFDHNYNLEDTTKLYCTELVQLLFKRIGIDLAQGRITTIICPGMSGDYIMPSDIYKNKNMTTVFTY